MLFRSSPLIHRLLPIHFVSLLWLIYQSLKFLELLDQIPKGDYKALARAISIVENETEGYEELLFGLNYSPKTPVIGVTGPPGAGKSTLINALVNHLISKGKKVAIVAVDPTSPFNYGSLLGDRLRMSGLFTHPNVFIRSLATRGSLGGLHPKIIEITDLVKSAAFDFVIVETVGVGQSEVEVAGLADRTVVVLVPEAGDEIQTMKAGLLEIADLFVVNKSDRPDAGRFRSHLERMMQEDRSPDQLTPIVSTVPRTVAGTPSSSPRMSSRAVRSSCRRGRCKNRSPTVSSPRRANWAALSGPTPRRASSRQRPRRDKRSGNAASPWRPRRCRRRSRGTACCRRCA